ncbi:MAG: hypothetical protein G01um101416_955 [Microgenomates group bacterium Gr01-1014_16]|nr:MAG: hypothetical protein G01um101416_955 [Microgenomates group bacterium Gr01-1014_16]
MACLELYRGVSYIDCVAVKKLKNSKTLKLETPEPVVVEKNDDGDKLDPQEEKVLDWILKAIVIFVLGWLALGVLMAVGGLFGIWK